MQAGQPVVVQVEFLQAGEPGKGTGLDDGNAVVRQVEFEAAPEPREGLRLEARQEAAGQVQLSRGRALLHPRDPPGPRL